MADKNEIIAKMKELFPEGRISCIEARALAQEWNMETREIGELCDDAGIKIYGCELGCF